MFLSCLWMLYSLVEYLQDKIVAPRWHRAAWVLVDVVALLLHKAALRVALTGTFQRFRN